VRFVVRDRFEHPDGGSADGWGEPTLDEPLDSPTPEAGAGLALLRFVFGGASYGVVVERVLEVVPMVTIRAVPGAPEGVAGVINVRGTLIPIFQLEMPGQPPAPRSASQCIVLAEAGPAHGHVPFGFIVDELVDVRVSPAAELCLPATRLGYPMSPTTGAVRIGDEVLPLVDLDALLRPERAVALVDTEDAPAADLDREPR
jgi:chemotaxis signal transduction protein